MGLKFFLNVDHAHLQVLDNQVSEFLQLTFADASVHTASTHQEAMVLDEKTKNQLKKMGATNKLYVDPHEKDPHLEDEESSVESGQEDYEVIFVCRSVEEEFMTKSESSNHPE